MLYREQAFYLIVSVLFKSEKKNSGILSTTLIFNFSAPTANEIAPHILHLTAECEEIIQWEWVLVECRAWSLNHGERKRLIKFN